jgi:amino acid transporter
MDPPQNSSLAGGQPFELKRELRLSHLVLAQVLFILAPAIIGPAATLGASHLIMWLCVGLLFLCPLVSVATFLTRRMPLEGGIYNWVEVVLGPRAGFIVAWNVWFYGILLLAQIGVITTTYFAYVLGPRMAWIAESKTVTIGAAVVIIIFFAAQALSGLNISKRTYSIGGWLGLVIFIFVIIIPLIATPLRKDWLSVALPPLTPYSLNIASKLAMVALAGFEYLAVLAGECETPGKSLTRSAWIAAPILLLMYIFGTNSLLAFVAPGNVDLVGPIPQIISTALKTVKPAGVAPGVCVVLLWAVYVASGTVVFTVTTRLPMVAGWHGAIPGWFSRIDSGRQMPGNSIRTVAVISLTFAIFATFIAGRQEAYQLLVNAAYVCYSIAYLALFSMPMIGYRRLRPSRWLCMVSVSGFLITLAFMAFSIFPIVDVPSWLRFGAILISVVTGINLVGLSINELQRRRVT